MYSRFLAWLLDWAKRVSASTPYFPIGAYMDRWWVVKRRWWMPFCVRLHHIKLSDRDRHLHDHPFSYCTLILSGGYWEVTEVDGKIVRRWCGPGRLLFRRATSAHRLVVTKPDGCWTLFCMTPSYRDWGFWVDQKWVYWREYLNDWTSDPV